MRGMKPLVCLVFDPHDEGCDVKQLGFCSGLKIAPPSADTDGNVLEARDERSA